MRFFLDGNIGSSSSSSNGAIGIVSKDTILVARIIGYKIALKMASSASKATMYRFSFRQAMIEAPVKKE
jgi:hypothetical protein